MSQNFPITKLAFALMALSAASLTQAAGLDRSGQEIKGFFNPGTYAEIDYAYINTDVSVYDNAGNPFGITGNKADYKEGKNTGNATEDPYTFMRYGVKTDVNDNISIGVFYDEPFGAEVEYTGDNTFVSRPGDRNLISADGGPNGTPEFALQSILNPSVNDPNYDKNTNVSVHTESWTGIVGFKSNGFQVYGGPVIQKAKAEVHLRGQAYGPLTGYDANVNSDTDYGWLAGVAYSKPEIALNASLTYRSEIDHETAVGERVPALGNTFTKNQFIETYNKRNPNNLIDADLAARIGQYATTEATVTTPESVNLNIQTGLSKEYQLLGTLDVRWVPWSDFSIVPPLYNAYSKGAVDGGLPLLSYSEDQWKVDVGLAKRFNEKLAGSVVVGYDSGAGDPVSSLGTIDGFYSIGGGVKYNVTPEWALSVGGKYLKFGDATGQLPNGSIVSQSKDNDGYIAGVKLSYQSQ